MDDQNKNELKCPKCGSKDVQILPGISRAVGPGKEGGKLPDTRSKCTAGYCNECEENY